jgi:hypothetical protein
MCLIGLLIHFQVHNWALSSNNSMVLFHYNRYCKLDSSGRLTRLLPKCSAHIRYVYVLGNVLVTYSLIQITLAHISSTVPWGEDIDSVQVNCIVSLAMLCSFSCKSSFLAFTLTACSSGPEASLYRAVPCHARCRLCRQCVKRGFTLAPVHIFIHPRLVRGM